MTSEYHHVIPLINNDNNNNKKESVILLLLSYHIVWRRLFFVTLAERIKKIYCVLGTTWCQEMTWCIANDLDFEGAKQFLPERFPFLE